MLRQRCRVVLAALTWMWIVNGRINEGRDSRAVRDKGSGQTDSVELLVDRRTADTPPRRVVYNDGGRSASGYRGTTGDCVTRAIAIATKLPYQQVYDEINALAVHERRSKRRRRKSSAATGVHKPTIRKYLVGLGWRWIPTMKIGSGCKVHLRAEELPKGRLIVHVSKHVVAVIDGVVHDTHDPSRGGTRCVYGYWIKDLESI